jgi:hypothetical protein
MCFPEGVFEQNKHQTHPNTEQDRVTSVIVAQAHPEAHLAKAVQGGTNQGAPLLPLGPTLQEAVHSMPLLWLHVVLTKNNSQTNLLHTI